VGVGREVGVPLGCSVALVTEKCLDVVQRHPSITSQLAAVWRMIRGGKRRMPPKFTPISGAK
jgi:hypothetical protein